MDEVTYKTIIGTLVARHDDPQDIITVLAEVSALDYLDWEGLIEEREAENRVARLFMPCSECGIVSNRQSWVSVKRLTSGTNKICADCARPLRASHTYTCAWCNTAYLSLKPQESGTSICSLHESRLEFVRKHLRRAELLNLPATLTVSQWSATVKHFNSLCAYCNINPYTDMEHYLPLSLGGGTTAINCLPSCASCNFRKRDKHPDTFARIFPPENIARIEAYFTHVRPEDSSSMYLDL